jgi:rhodanese-related sulfurtransferase
MAYLIRKTFRASIRASVGATVILVLLSLTGCTAGFEWLLGVDAITPEELMQSLQAGESIRIVDVGPRDAYGAQHLPGARWVDFHRLESRLPQLLNDRTAPVVFTCPGGYLSALAVVMAKGQGFSKVASLHGGVTQWRRRGYVVEKGFSSNAGVTTPAPHLTPMSPGQQWAAMVSGLGFKPVYMALTLALILGLWRTRDRDIALIRRGLLAFFIGEAFCALNYLLFGGANDFFDMLHGLGMVLMGALLSWGMAVFLDERMVHVSAAASVCVFKRLCGPCWKNQKAPCRLHRLLVFAAPALAVLALMPWCLPLRSLYQVSKVYATPVLYSYSPGLQLIDFRAYSLLALVFFVFAMARLLRGAPDFRAAQFSFFAGVGLLSFSLFRFFLLETYRQSPAWMDFWEEATELIMILGLCWFLFHYRIEAGLRPFAHPFRKRPAPDEGRVEP